MAKEFAKAFYHSDAWLQTRKAYSKSVGNLCEVCFGRGLYVPGKVVHHIVHLSPENINNPAVTLGWNNLRLVCQDCHAKEHAEERQDCYLFDEAGNIVQAPIEKC